MNNDVTRKNKIRFIDSRLDYFFDRPALILSLIGVIGITIRLHYLPYNIPIAFDGLNYFWYAIDTNVLGYFPSGQNFPNNGWPAFLSLFFTFVKSGNFLDYMNLQRVISVVISVLTIIPLYSLLRKFVRPHYAMFGLVLFVFEPRIIENSLLGITDVAFLFLIITSISFLLSNNSKVIYCSFVIAALSSLVRYEGILLLIPFSVVFFIKFKNKDKMILRYLLVLAIFALVVLPMAYLRVQTTGKDGLVSHVGAASNFVYNTTVPHGSSSKSFNDFVLSAITQLVKYSGWLTIPNYVWFFPLGIIVFFTKLNFEKKVIILITIFLVAAPSYAYGRGIQEIRYLFVLIPLFSIISILGFEKIIQRTNHEKLLVTTLSFVVIIGLIVLLTLNPFEHQKELERYEIAQEVVLTAKGTNDITHIVKYYKSAALIGHEFPMQRIDSLKFIPKVVDTKSFSTLTDYLNYGMNNDLTHLILDGKSSSFLDDAYNNEEKYPYLMKRFDSADRGFYDHVKIFEINYEEFRQNYLN